MTAPLPQPDRMQPADFRDIADFLDTEAIRERLANNDIQTTMYVHLTKTARFLRDKAARMEKQ